MDLYPVFELFTAQMFERAVRHENVANFGRVTTVARRKETRHRTKTNSFDLTLRHVKNFGHSRR